MPIKNNLLKLFGSADIACGLWLFITHLPSLFDRYSKFERLAGWAGFFLIALGLLAWAKNRSSLLANIHLSLTVAGLSFFLFGELFFRLVIAADIPHFKEAKLYADPFSDDDYWKLNYQWENTLQHEKVATMKSHPRLGWFQGSAFSKNSQALNPKVLEQTHSSKKKILVYGDSYIRGSEKDIPAFLSEALPDLEIVNLGAGGFGTDQIFLAMQETFHLFSDVSVVIVGIMLTDIDRAILSLRVSKKPRFRTEKKGELILEGVPIRGTPTELFESHPLKLRSYFIAYLKNTVFANPFNQYRLKTTLNAAILKAMKQQLELFGVNYFFIVFYPKALLLANDWRESFLKNTLLEQGMPFFDTKPFLIQYAKGKGISPLKLYGTENPHHTIFANGLIAEQLALQLSTLGTVPPLPSSVQERSQAAFAPGPETKKNPL
ncbi:MAG: hypothetical protein ACOY3K_05015 [Candidatus Omnitrophota bacterium]